MRTVFVGVTAKLAWLALAGLCAPAGAADINVLSAAGIRGVVVEIGQQFERSTSHKVTAKFVGGPVVRQSIAAGENFDVAISQPSEIERLVKDGKIVPDTRAGIARSGMGMGVRKGTAKPDIGSPDAFKRVLISAKSIAYAGDGASGEFFLGLFKRLGVSAEVKPKLKPMPAGTAAAEAVGRGEAEIVLLSVPSILAVAAVDLVSPLPDALQYYSGFAAGVVTSSKQVEPGKAFIRLLTAPTAAGAIKKNGMVPGA